MDPIYSICIANYNMDSTLEYSLESILSQLDNRFEVIVVDDGSSDNSLEILDLLISKYSSLRVIPLLRDNRRKLGETRNVSVRAARGKYVLLHIDTDDFWEPFIVSFTKVFHELEKRLNLEDFMLSGMQIQMATKKLILDCPYPNIYYVEDRTLWNNLAVLGKLFFLEHKIFRKRLPIKNKKKKLLKVISSKFSGMSAAYAYSPNLFKITMDYISTIKINFHKSFNFSLMISILLVPSLINGRFLKRKPLNNQINGDCRLRNKINLTDIEKNSLVIHGKFNLNSQERKIYFT